MSIVLDNKLQISEFQRELGLLRSFVIGIAGKDKEGNYQPEFVKRILKNLREEPKYTFKDKKSFLAQVNKNL
jgi:hypothetical protein